MPDENKRQYAAANVAPSELSKIIDSATKWSIEYEYLPCEYQMCAAILDSGNPNVIWVSIVPEIHVEGWVPPAVSIYLSAESYSVEEIGEGRHTGCAYRTRLDNPR